MSMVESMGTVEPWWHRVSIDKWKPWRKHITLQGLPFNRGSSQDRPGLLRAAVYIASLLPRHWESALLKSPAQVRRDIHAAAALLPSVPRWCHPLRIFYVHAHVYILIHSRWILNKTEHRVRNISFKNREFLSNQLLVKEDIYQNTNIKNY